MSFNRRSFLQSSLFTGVIASLPKSVWAWNEEQNRLLRMQTDASPIARATQATSIDFNGDDISRPHDILWDKYGYLEKKGGKPAPSEKANVVVVGGGMAGLLSAYYLRDQKPIILEQDPRFGGNSKGESYKKSAYSIGAAYFCVPDEGSRTETLLKELGLYDKARLEEDTNVRFNGVIQPGFWKGSTDPQRKEEFVKFNAVLADILENSFPDVPLEPDSQITRAQLNALDSISFETWMEQQFGKVHPHIKEYMQLYAWSSFGGSISEISAAQMLNYVAAETGGIMSLPGGNSAIAEALWKAVQAASGASQVRSGAFVLDISYNSQGVEVCYEDVDGNIKTIQAKTCIVASPKFVAKHIISDVPASQLKAMGNLPYRGYIVANVILNKRIQSPTYELYSLEGEVPEVPMAMNPPKRDFTDICFGTWAVEDKVDNSVLTMYMALPYDGARQFLFNPMAHQKYQAKVQKVLPELLKSLNLTTADVEGVRLTRWGHSLPLARFGMIASGLAEEASRPIGNKIFFAQQDNWANPCFEACEVTAHMAAEQVKKVL